MRMNRLSFRKLVVGLLPILLFVWLSSFKFEISTVLSFPWIVWRFKQITLILIIGSVLVFILKTVDWRYRFNWLLPTTYLLFLFYLPYHGILSVRYLDFFNYLVSTDYIQRIKRFWLIPYVNFFMILFLVQAIIIVFLILKNLENIYGAFNFIFINFFLYCCLAAPIDLASGFFKAEKVQSENILRLFFSFFPIFSALIFFMFDRVKNVLEKVPLFLFYCLGSFCFISFLKGFSFSALAGDSLYFIDRYVILSNTFYLVLIIIILWSFRKNSSVSSC